MRPHFLLSIILFSTTISVGANNKQLRLSSPDGRNEVVFSKPGKELTYYVTVDGREVICPSRAGLQLDNRVWEMALGKRDLAQPDCWMDPLTIDSVSYQTPVDTEWHPLYGERSTVHDRYNSATLHLSRKDKSKYRLDVQVRAYDEGIAFRYFFPEHPDAIFHKVTADLTDYRFPEGTMAWSEQWAQARFDHTPVDSISRPAERALTLELPGGQWVALLDADVDDWCLTKLIARTDKPSTLSSVMYSPVDVVTYAATPWKVVMTADSPAKLLQNNDIILNLNPPAKGDFSWVKPGKIMRSKIDTDMGLATIDFCAEHDIDYMLYDWQWYMPCTSHDGDATKVVPTLDMQRVIDYGKEKGVGVWLYVNQHALMKQMDELLPLLKKWGVVGVKSGFVQYASHRWSTWLHDMVAKAAKNGLMMNIHDEFRPSGYSRTYPNLLTQEGICGNEEFPDATHNVTLPFTRMINGAADYTICYFDKRLCTSHAHQLAASLVFYSPLQTIFWYDNPTLYKGEKEIKWFEDLETVFDDTRVLGGYPGRDITIARRKGDIWWAAAMVGNEGGKVEFKLADFLTPGVQYIAEIYSDETDSKKKSRTNVAISQKKVKAGDTLRFDVPQSGGVAIRFVPVGHKADTEVTAEYTNPVIHADYSDPDVVATPGGRTFYMTASSFQCTPGLPILRSHDLVNWTVVNHALKAVPPTDFFGTGTPRHGKGVWAPCIKYHNGEYFIYWGDPDFGIFMTKASDPEGEWSEPLLVKAGKGMIDPSPLWDNDGKAYLANGWAGSRSGFNSVITISEMSPDGTRLISEPRIVFDGNDGVNHTVEGPKFYRHGDYYYLLAPAGGVTDGWQLAMRSKNVYGPYEAKIVMARGNSDINGPHQGGWITTADGEDWFLHFQDKGAYGRVVHLNPLHWRNDWPVIGADKDGDGCGEPVSSYPLPSIARNATQKPLDGKVPAELFQWHANYDSSFGFPLPEDYVRIYGHRLSSDTANFWEVPNLWLMKFPAEEFTFTAETLISAKGNTEGVSSGMIVMGRGYHRLGLTKRGNGFVLQLASCDDAEGGAPETVQDIAVIPAGRIYEAGLYPNLERALTFKLSVSKGAECQFYYSDSKGRFVKAGDSFTARPGKWIGAKVGFYSVTPPDCSERGWIDVIKLRLGL